MADGSKIEWTDATWNPITGCSVVSPGCTNCYAMRLAGTRMKHHASREGQTVPTKAGPVWNGRVRFNAEWLDQPLRWRRPRRVFVCAHGDLFHENVPDGWIDQVFAAMALAPHHVFQVLTKRPERMRAYMADRSNARADGRGEAVVALGYTGPLEVLHWPLPNVWLGVSAEDQARADERVPHLLATLAAVRWISAEPLLGPINLRRCDGLDALTGFVPDDEHPERSGYLPGRPRVDWVVAGGESGRGARPMHPAWATSLRDQCRQAGVPLFFKQWGDWARWEPGLAGEIAHVSARDGRRFTNPAGVGETDGPRSDTVQMVRAGKKVTGRLLEGREWSEEPRGFERAA